MAVTAVTRSSGNKRKSQEESMPNLSTLEDASTSDDPGRNGLHPLQPEDGRPIAKKKRGGKPKGAQKFTETDELRMLNSVSEAVTSGHRMGDIWRTVETAYNRRCDEACSGRKHRDFKFLRKHFSNLLSFCNPDTESACPPNVSRAYELQRAIEEIHIAALCDNEGSTATRNDVHSSRRVFPVASTRSDATGTAREALFSTDVMRAGCRTADLSGEQRTGEGSHGMQGDHDDGVQPIAQGPAPTPSAIQPASRDFSIIDPFNLASDMPVGRSSVSIEAPATTARQKGLPQVPTIGSDGMPVFAPPSEAQYQFYRDFVPLSCYETLEKLLLEEKMERKEAQNRVERLEKENQKLKDSHHASLLALQKHQAKQDTDGRRGSLT